MARKFNDAIDLSFNELQNVVAQNLPDDPTGDGVEPGRFFYSTGTNVLRLRTDAAWVSLGIAGAGLSDEQVQDITGLMVSGNVETGIAVTYDDTANKIDFALDTEYLQDQVGGMWAGNTLTGLTVTYQDADGTIDAAVTDSPLLGGQNGAYYLARANHTGTQTAATISDFAEAVQDITGGALTDSPTIDWTYDDTAGTATGAVLDSPLLGGQNSAYHLSRANHTGTQSAATISDFTEATQDAIGVGFANGTQTGATLTYDDTANSLSIAVTNSPLLGGNNSAYHLARANHTGTQTADTISDFAEATSDQIGTMVTGNTATGITVAYQDADNTLDFAVTDSPLLGGQNGAYYRARANHTGTQTAATISDFDTAARGLFSVTDTGTLDLTYNGTTGAISGAVLDSPTVGGATAAQLRDRATHTGTQTTATISDFAEAVSDQVGTMITGNTETGITVTYDDADNTLDLAVSDSPLLGGNNGAYYLSRTNHTGTQAAGTISDLAATVQGYTLDLFADPVAAITMNGQKITGLANGTADGDAINLGQLNSAVAGLDNKASVRVAATGNVDVAAAPAAIDGVTLAATNRVLLTGQTAGAENGIWIFNGAGAAMTRATDADINAEVTSGLYVFVDQGTTQANKGYQLFTDDPIVLGTTALNFQPVSGAGQITAGAGLTKTGDTIDAVEGLGIDVTADAIAVDRTTNGAKVALIYAQDMTGGATSEVVTHGLGTQDVVVFVYLDGGTFAEEEFSIEHTSVNTVTIRSATTIPATTYRVVVFG